MKFSRLNPRLTAIALPIAAVVIAGCGGGGGDTSEATQAKKPEAPAKLSKAEFIARGDGICGEVNSAVGSIEQSEAEVASSEQAAQIASLYTGMIERLIKLGSPAEMDGYAEFSESAEMLGKVESEVKAAAEEEDLVGLEETSNEAVPALENFQNAAAVYGFEACSEGPQAPSPATGAGAGAGATEEPGIEEGGVEPELEEEFVPEEEVAPEEEFVPEEEVAPETGGAGGVGEGEGEVGGGEEESSGGGIGPG